ncbi:MAG: matrixin family metalloprotease [Candidatus Nitrosopumilus limneticus]|nr:TPR REGION domain-containing protein [Candidatus Nitrosopumilus limneticus]MDC4212309.1 matrixin family metalloprotease [Candidatus Nitrosopumilus limneticus]MDC4215182.1 matrixin family metalloprotease [Candidatus Nitrosopumilus limneticus]MDC4215891.1 matrixin family metalloprotease [Candidatus Nitrosopumilus limneticus]MDC4217280.1 matrixin family metalloprotease [Candidatus Nitrosopumilus limneticus]
MKTLVKILFFCTIILFFLSHSDKNTVFAQEQTPEQLELLFNQATELFQNGDYNQAITIYDQILESSHNNISTLNMKGIAYSNMEQHTLSLKQFYIVLEKDPNNAKALLGMGVGFGNLGEYSESLEYLEKAEKINPNSEVIKNYKDIVVNTLKKYPYTPTEKPTNTMNLTIGKVPEWIKQITNWWSLGNISDEKFIENMEYMIKKEIIVIPENKKFDTTTELKMISMIRNNFNQWGQNEIPDEEFYKNMNWLIENKFIKINLQKSTEEIEYESYLFDKYLQSILKNKNSEIRYIEYPNPSQDVIKKFLRDYAKWNFEQQAQMTSKDFPYPTYKIIDEEYIIKYKIYINDQPPGLPLDHVSTLKNSFEFWEKMELTTNNQTAKVVFEITTSKTEANVWVTWVVRNLGDGVLGHAHLGKGIVEVALGDYNCDGSFQLYDVKSVNSIMTHELGHSIGLPHTNDKENIMYPSMTPSYAYCMLS